MELKFRGWMKNMEMMVDLQKLTPLATSAEGLFIPSSDLLIVMQFTGLKDKNGKEIYEGDILTTEYERTLEVRWRKGSWYVYERDEEFCPLMGVPGIAGYISEEIEVIGNIYENPERTNG